MLPLDLAQSDKLVSYLVFGAIGFAFGVVLELAGFGNAKKLAAQFYFKDMTVLKTMFTGILTASLLIFATASIGWLDFSKIYVNQTYLWPGIIGGLVMGVGFVVGGYCPGTSAVSAASLKIDGLMFLVGTVIGATLFGESVESFERFFNASYTERLLLSDTLGWSIGAAVVGVTLLALAFFYGAEKTEEAMAHPGEKIHWMPTNRRYLAAGGLALVVALGIWVNGQPTPEEKWERVGEQYQPLLDKREAFVHPLEYVKTWNDAAVKLVTLDLRPATDFDGFHLDSARNVDFDGLVDPDLVFELNQLPAQGVVVLVADDEAQGVAAWKRLKAEGVTNLYLLDGGLRGWKTYFEPVAGTPHFDFARPPAKVLEAYPKDAYTPHIKLKTSRRAAGLCS